MRELVFIDVRGKRIESFTCGDLVVDAPKWSCFWKGQRVKLARVPMLLVHHLARRPGVIKLRHQVLEAIASSSTDHRVVDSCVKRARAAFRDIDPDFNQIGVVYGAGYFWRK